MGEAKLTKKVLTDIDTLKEKITLNGNINKMGQFKSFLLGVQRTKNNANWSTIWMYYNLTKVELSTLLAKKEKAEVAELKNKELLKNARV